MKDFKDERAPFDVALGRLGGLFACLSDEQTRDRGALAALRKGVGEPGGWHPATAMVVDRAIGNVRLSRSEDEVLFMTAALFGLHPVVAPRKEATYPPSLLASLSTWMQMVNRISDDDRKAMDRRVLALLNADREDLLHHLRHLIGMLRGSDVGIDWLRLARDVKAWDLAERRVQRAWARDWWRAPHWTEDQVPVTDVVASGNE